MWWVIRPLGISPTSISFSAILPCCCNIGPVLGFSIWMPRANSFQVIEVIPSYSQLSASGLKVNTTFPLEGVDSIMSCKQQSDERYFSSNFHKPRSPIEHWWFLMLQHYNSPENNPETPFDFTDTNYEIVSPSHPTQFLTLSSPSHAACRGVPTSSWEFRFSILLQIWHAAPNKLCRAFQLKLLCSSHQ